MTICPRCGEELVLNARFCWKCEEYLDRMDEDGAPVEPSPRAAGVIIPDDRLEDVIQEAGRKALELLGFTVYSLSQDRATRQTPGVADTYVVGHGRAVWAEWKRPGKKHKQSLAQIAFEADVTANGAEYQVWRHESDATEWARAVIQGSR